MLNFFCHPDPPARAGLDSVHSKSCLVLESSYASVSRLEQFLSGLKQSWKFSELLHINIRVSLNEALTNSIEHGNKPVSGKNIYIHAQRTETTYQFTVQDEGKGFDEESIQDPLSDGQSNTPVRSGIFIMKHLADAVHYTNHGRCLTLVFLQKTDR